MANNFISVSLSILDTLAQLLLATERRLNRKNGWIAAIVALMIPAHQTQLRLINTLSLQLIDDILNLIEGCYHAHFGLILESLMLDWRRHWLPSLTNTNLWCGSCIGEVLVILHALLQHLWHIVVVDEVLTIATRHCAIVVRTLLHRIEVDDEWLISTTFRQIILVRECVVALLEGIDLSTLKAQTLTNCEVATTLGLEAAHSQAEVLRLAEVVFSEVWMFESIEKTIIGNEVALLTLYCSRKRRGNNNRRNTL